MPKGKLWIVKKISRQAQRSVHVKKVPLPRLTEVGQADIVFVMSRKYCYRMHLVIGVSANHYKSALNRLRKSLEVVPARDL